MAAPPPTQESREHRPTVLIMDDEAGVRRLLRTTVDSLPFPCEVMEAADGKLALEIARRHRPTLALLDILLPGSSTSGVIVCSELCKDARTKVVIITGQKNDTITKACLSMGAVDIVTKPFSVDELRAKLTCWLSE
jgi:two-component system, OmpR family, alkaline phosphatase synthesis response regulator PhoP